MSISRSDLLALVLALAAGVASVVVWANGTVTLGLTLGYDGQFVRVFDVTPDGNAHRNYWYPGETVVAITTVDGSTVEGSDETIGEIVGGATAIYNGELFPQEIFTNFGDPITTLDAESRLPAEAVEAERIQSVVSGYVEPDVYFEPVNVLDRTFLEYRLSQSIWIAAIGLLLGGLLWRLLAHGIAGDIGRRHAMLLGASVATPFLIVPVVQVGTPVGVAAGYLTPAAVALVLGQSFARQHPETQWAQTAMAAAAVAAGLVAVLVVRYLSAPTLNAENIGPTLLLTGTIAIVPALIAAATPMRPARERFVLVTLGMVPAAAITLLASRMFDATVPIILLSLLIGAQFLPSLVSTGGRLAHVGQRLERLRSDAAATRVSNSDPAVVTVRDRLTYSLIGLAMFLSLAMPVVAPVADFFMVGAWPLVIGVGLASLVGFGVRRGFLGSDWTDAAVPLAAAVGVPVMLAGSLGYAYGRSPIGVLPTALAALSVAHVLALRHPDEGWRKTLFGASGAVVALVVLLSITDNGAIATVLTGLVAVIPGMIAFADEAGEPRALTSRLETFAVAITPGVGATMLFPSVGLILLGAWLLAIVIWRQFTLRPLLGMAMRTQIQRDVAVAAAETERARLAADLHDDALQQLTMLVRTLDEGGHAREADEAREIATKLRSVVGDLRLPILDDLGAGAALEWLVERVEPLAGGTIKLERSDETRPPANVELAVFRVAQEALTNAIKHGKPPIAVRYDVRTDGRVTLAIDDAGEGIGSEAADEAPKEGHFGLVNMQQRAEQIGALLDVRRWPAGGTRVALEWRPQ
ncbi:MAG TPA: ATP-binding protein [Candidatus Limnocylindria bacterium]|nr:ATP-binding protein [Candidatus Limnocylindria bacterium]